MAYPYNNPYQQMTFPQYQQPIMPQMQPMNSFQTGNSSPIQQNTPIQTGFVRVQSEDEARRYPVAPGGSITFIDDNSPHCYVKSAGLSQLDAPVFKRFRLVEENEPTQSAKNDDISNVLAKDIDLSEYVKKREFDEFKQSFDEIIRSVDKLRFDVDALGDKSTKKMVQKARKDADEE